MINIVEYEDEQGNHPYSKWFATLNVHAALKIRTAIARMELGNLSNAKGVGQGVIEYRLDFGPGYRIYYGRDGEQLIILLGGGTKKRQSRDIEYAQALWKDYKRRKREGS